LYDTAAKPARTRTTAKSRRKPYNSGLVIWKEETFPKSLIRTSVQRFDALALRCFSLGLGGGHLPLSCHLKSQSSQRGSLSEWSPAGNPGGPVHVGLGATSRSSVLTVSFFIHGRPVVFYEGGRRKRIA
jgi:hypothetical protein